MKHTRFFAISLLTALFVTSVSCGEAEPEDSVNTGTSEDTEAVETDYYDTLGLESFGGTTFTILCQSGSETEFYAESENGEVVNDKIYESNRNVEDGLGISLEIVQVDGGWSNKDIFTNYVTSSVMSGADDFQMLLGYMYYMPSLITENLFLDINTLPTINLDNPWWTAGFNDNATINDRMYMAMGDICTSRLRTTNCVFANTGLMKEYGYEISDLYDEVRAGTWTFDKLTALAQTASADLNGDGAIDKNDLHGLGITFMGIRAMTNAFAIDYTTRDENGLPQLALYGDRFVEAYELMYNTIHSQWLYTAPNNYTVPEDMIPKFKEDRLMFLINYLGSTCAELRDMESDYAVLPLPKYDENQEDYRTECSDAVSILMVPVTASNHELVGAVMETMNYEAYQNVTPAYFDTTLQGKYARDEDSQEMMDLIRDSIYFDFGYIFAGVIGGDINKLMDSSVTNPNIASIWASKSPTMEQNLESLLEFFRQD